MSQRKNNNPNSHKEYLQQVSEGETAVILSELREILARKVSGDIVEFGCYRGDTSLLIERILEREFSESPSRLWIYDSFEGLPARTREDASVAGDDFRQGELNVSKREVVERFKKAGLHVPRVRKGFFENLDDGGVRGFDSFGVSGIDLATNDLPSEIAFAFLDLGGRTFSSWMLRTPWETVSTQRMSLCSHPTFQDSSNEQSNCKWLRRHLPLTGRNMEFS